MPNSWRDPLEPPPHGLARLRQRIRHETERRQRKQLSWRLTAGLILALILVALPLRHQPTAPIGLDPDHLLDANASPHGPKVKQGAAVKLVETKNAVYYQLIMAH